MAPRISYLAPVRFGLRRYCCELAVDVCVSPFSCGPFDVMGTVEAKARLLSLLLLDTKSEIKGQPEHWLVLL